MCFFIFLCRPRSLRQNILPVKFYSALILKGLQVITDSKLYTMSFVRIDKQSESDQAQKGIFKGLSFFLGAAFRYTETDIPAEQLIRFFPGNKVYG